MSTIRVSTTIAAAIAALALSAIPASAQESRREGGDRQEQSRGERRRPRADSGGQRGQGRQAQAGRAPRDNNAQASREAGANNQRAVPRREAVPRASVDRGNRNRDQARRVEPQRGSRNAWRYDDRRDRDRDRRYDVRPGNGRYLPPARVNRGYSRPSRVYVVPYGYRPRGYRSGWNVNLYFGRPYGYYAPGYYGSRNYGYYALPAGFAYGSLRIVDAPRRAAVFVDGYYAGEVDDYDGIFQRLNLEPGQHLVEIDVYPGAPPMEFDVYIVPGRTVTIHARP